MHIEKAIRTYFVFLVMVISLAGVTQVNEKTNYFSSVLHVFGDSLTMGTPGLQAPPKPVAVMKKLIDLKIENDPAGTLTFAGEKNKEIMRYVIKADLEPVKVKSLRLRLVGVNPLAIEKASVVIDGEVMAYAKHNNEYLEFAGLNYTVEAGKMAIFSFNLDVSPYTLVGTRIRLDLEHPEDFIALVGEAPAVAAGNYPIKGEALTVVKAREW